MTLPSLFFSLVMALLFSHFIFLFFVFVRYDYFFLIMLFNPLLYYFAIKTICLICSTFFYRFAILLLQIRIAKNSRKNSKCNNNLDLVNTFFGAAYKNFY